jgi:hypothetical protein
MHHARTGSEGKISFVIFPSSSKPNLPFAEVPYEKGMVCGHPYESQDS